MVWVNNPMIDNDALPFGGWKASGLGRELGRMGLDTFRRSKMVIMDHRPVRRTGGIPIPTTGSSTGRAEAHMNGEQGVTGRTIVILGGAGLMGQGIVRDLLSDRAIVDIAELRLCDTATDRMEALAHEMGDPRLTTRLVDVTDADSLRVGAGGGGSLHQRGADVGGLPDGHLRRSARGRGRLRRSGRAWHLHRQAA
jgi:hypothetical protein